MMTKTGTEAAVVEQDAHPIQKGLFLHGHSSTWVPTYIGSTQFQCYSAIILILKKNRLVKLYRRGIVAKHEFPWSVS